MCEALERMRPEKRYQWQQLIDKARRLEERARRLAARVKKPVEPSKEPGS